MDPIVRRRAGRNVAREFLIEGLALLSKNVDAGTLLEAGTELEVKAGAVDE